MPCRGHSSATMCPIQTKRPLPPNASPLRRESCHQTELGTTVGPTDSLQIYAERFQNGKNHRMPIRCLPSDSEVNPTLPCVAPVLVALFLMQRNSAPVSSIIGEYQGLTLPCLRAQLLGRPLDSARQGPTPQSLLLFFF
jgi:hypothetical protein